MTRARSLLLAGAVGALFGAGLLISGMTQPAKIVGFLDLSRRWDPSLAFVMAGAVGLYAILFRAIRKRGRPWLDATFHLPTRRDLDVSLIVGAGIFGVGWGLGGLCPGPAIVAAASGSLHGVAFVAAMLAGMYVQHSNGERLKRLFRRVSLGTATSRNPHHDAVAPTLHSS